MVAGIRHQYADTVVVLDWIHDVTPGQYVATLDTILEAAPDSVVRLPPDAPARVVAHVAHDGRVITSSEPCDGSRATITMMLRTPVAWAPTSLRHLLDDLREETATIVEIVDGSETVATITPSRAAGRVRRAAARGSPPHALAELTRFRRVGVTAIDASVLRGDTDLAAELGGWDGDGDRRRSRRSIGRRGC